jgi:23S rRNA (cytidine1920-2'-O)/16S rRNA (cytidine1409-2'-O)-methyltransferase
MPKSRLDLLLVERGLADSRSQAQRLVMAGQVRVEGQVALKPSASVDANAQLTIDQPPPFVSRGGEKLEAALQAFDVSPQGRICADVGASTGGFTDCLLQHEARRVYAIDVGQGILHWKLRQDPRVVVLEKTNARYLTHLPEPVALVTIDASFISLKLLLPVVHNWFPLDAPHQDLLALIKPQFEAGRKQVARGDGVIRDPEIHRQVLLDVLAYAIQDGYAVRGLLRSPLLGPKGNAEFLAWLSYLPPRGSSSPTTDLAALVEGVVPLSQP